MPDPGPFLVVLNPAAGNGRAGGLTPRVAAWLADHRTDAQVVETQAPGEAEELAAAAGREGRQRVIAVGGDGTVQEVVNGILASSDGRDEPLSLGVVPGGSGNDLARSLGLPSALDNALAVAVGERTTPLDLGRATGDGRVRHFAAAGGTGFDGQVAWAMAGRPHGWQRRRLGYLLQTLRELRRFRNPSLRIGLDLGDDRRDVEGRHLFVAFANGAYYGGGMRICPDAKPDDGWLDVCLVGDIGRLGALRELPGIYRGRHVRHPLVTMVRVRALTIDGDHAARTHLDGEPFGGVPLEVSVRPDAIRVAVAESATVTS